MNSLINILFLLDIEKVLWYCIALRKGVKSCKESY